MRPNGSAKMRGFTLVEVLVSTALLASVFVAVVSLSAQSLRNLLRLEPHEIALMHARERMNQFLLLEELQPGKSSGSWNDGYRWAAQISQNAIDARASDGDYQLLDIHVGIFWGNRPDEKSYILETTQWAKMVKQNASH